MTSVFVSNTKRFEAKELNPEVAIPGPGMYNPQSFTEEINKKAQHKRAVDEARDQRKKQIDMMKDVNKTRVGIPSIPSREQAFGYTATNEGFKLNKPGFGYDGTLKSSAGPGEYNIPRTIDPQKMNGVKWRADSSKISGRSQQAQKIGPGYYNPTKEFKPLYKYKQSAAFASEAPRKFFDRENVSIASRKTKWTLNDDEDESEYIEEATPGPGYYYAPEVMTSFKKTTKDHQFQLFGSSAERFPHGQSTFTNIGPGKYHKEAQMVSHTHNKKLRRGGQGPVSKPAAAMKIKKDDQPGPGSYEVQNTVANI